MEAVVSVAVPASTPTTSPTWRSPAVWSSSMWTIGWLLRPGSFAGYTIMNYTLVRCPNNVLDFYEVIKYVSSNSKELGVDASRIAMAGERSVIFHPLAILPVLYRV